MSSMAPYGRIRIYISISESCAGINKIYTISRYSVNIACIAVNDGS